MPKGQLQWQPGFSLTRKPAKKAIARRKAIPAKGGNLRQYEFICEHPTGSGTHGPINLADSGLLATGPSPEDVPIAPATYRQAGACNSQTSLQVDSAGLSPNCPSPKNSRNDTTVLEGSEVTHLEQTVDCSEYTIHERAVLPRSGSTTPNLTKTRGQIYLNLSTPSTILYNNVGHRFQPVLDRYNEEFCKIPLTLDLQANPFQYHQGVQPEPPFLTHAAMALAGHHVESSSAEHHRGTALQLLREGLNTPGSLRNTYYMLDTIIILFSLDETQSALGNWRVHLKGALTLLEECGGPSMWTQSPRATVQVGLMTWWDAITSLVSREDCVFPYSYFEAAVSANTEEREWDYFRLCGCPLPLVEIVMRLARLSAGKRRLSSPVQYVGPNLADDDVITEIEKSLESWQHASPPMADQDEASMHQDMDSMHCAEAWRHSLLLYVQRVFRWEPGHRVPMSTMRRARVIVDHVFACREDSNMVAKQALLPLFFAGCELRDELKRARILRLCSLWDEATRYHMFDSTVPLLKEVWAAQERDGFDNVWWGQIVDRMHAAEEIHCQPLRRRLCFG